MAHVGALGDEVEGCVRLAKHRRSTRMPAAPVSKPTYLGLLNAVAVLFRQENFLFGFAAIALMTVGRPWRELPKTAMLYSAGGVAGSRR